jgi:hypothetical protein
MSEVSRGLSTKDDMPRISLVQDAAKRKKECLMQTQNVMSGKMGFCYGIHYAYTVDPDPFHLHDLGLVRAQRLRLDLSLPVLLS